MNLIIDDDDESEKIISLMLSGHTWSFDELSRTDLSFDNLSWM